jgi:RNA polymerase sigma-70 factor, ECF subfamily
MAVRSHAIDYQSLREPELVALARAGDREAFRLIMTRCNQRLFRIARSVVFDDSEAEDVLQEAYTRAFANFDSFRGDSSLLTWLTAITLNEARGRLRRRRSMVGVDAIEAAQARGAEILVFPGSPQSTDPERDAARAQIRALLEHAVDDLPEPFRLVFTMRDIEECTIEETAAALELKPETVKTRLFRARKLLRKALDEKLSAAVGDAFPFLGARCSGVTETVLRRLAPHFGWAHVP